MARFKLLSPHIFNTARGPALFETGTDVSDAEVIGFRCSALMQALDSEAEALLAAECDRLRAELVLSDAPGTVIGVGPTQCLPA